MKSFLTNILKLNIPKLVYDQLRNQVVKLEPKKKPIIRFLKAQAKENRDEKITKKKKSFLIFHEEVEGKIKPNKK